MNQVCSAVVIQIANLITMASSIPKYMLYVPATSIDTTHTIVCNLEIITCTVSDVISSTNTQQGAQTAAFQVIRIACRIAWQEKAAKAATVPRIEL